MKVEDALARLHERDRCTWHQCDPEAHWVVWEVRAGIRVVQFVWENGSVVFKLFHFSKNPSSGLYEWHFIVASHEFEEVKNAA